MQLRQSTIAPEKKAWVEGRRHHSFTQDVLHEQELTEVVNRERLCADVVNTGVAAALIGGFSLEKLDMEFGVPIYLLAVIAVHVCTCSCLCSAFLYRLLNKMRDDVVESFAKRHRVLLAVPMTKFGMGCVCYLLCVVVQSWDDLGVDPSHHAARIFALVFGSITVATVILTAAYVSCLTPKHAR